MLFVKVVEDFFISIHLVVALGQPLLDAASVKVVLEAKIRVVLRLPNNVAIKEGFKEGRSDNLVLGVNSFCLVSLELQDLFKNLHDREVNLAVV